MNATELLEQFIQEARECLERIGQRLLDIEKTPGDSELLNDLFRQVHTLKGNCGLFEFHALERVVHAGEDLLDRVRHGDLPYGPAIADALLEAMDYSAELVDAIEARGQLPAAQEDVRSQALSAALRQHLNGPATSCPPPASTDALPATSAPALPIEAGLTPSTTPSPARSETLPDWVHQRIPASLRDACADGVVLRYVPEPECFFKGEDPWFLARNTPGLQFLDVKALAPWPSTDDWDCYRCNLDMVVLSNAPRAYVEEHFRYVPEQIHLVAMTPPAPAPAPAPIAAVPNAPSSAPTSAAASAASHAQPPLHDTATHGHTPSTPGEEAMHKRLLQIWQEQLAVLHRAGIQDTTVLACRTVFERLLSISDGEQAPAARTALAAITRPSALSLAQWATQHTPGRSTGQANIGSPSSTGTATTSGGTPARLPPTQGPSTASGVTPDSRRAGNATDEPTGERGHKVLKVAQDKIDRLMELIGEMVVAKNALPYLATRAEAQYQQRDLAREIKTQYAVINRIAEDMQHAIMQVRMLPVGTIFQRFGRLVRDLAKKLGKDVRLVVEGEETEADKNVIEALADPLIHLVRNSLDHGLESPDTRRSRGKPAQGTLRVAAHQEGDRVILEISDDGAGIDVERVRRKAVERGLIPGDRANILTDSEVHQLVFLPGFSTADAVSDLSGRGVGMDVVRTAVERINGHVELSSQPGQGTLVRLTLPLSMAVTNVMMIEAAGQCFGVPMDLIVETVRVPEEDIHSFKQARTTVLRGRIVPLRPLSELLQLQTPPRPNEDGELAVLVVRLGQENIGLLVDDFHGTSDIILKPLEGVLAGSIGFAGTALMGDGTVLMILNPKELV